MSPAAPAGPSLAYLTVNYRTAGHVRAGLRAAAAACDPAATEYVIVDNSEGADDAGLDELGREFPGVRVLRDGGNVGFGAAVNRGVRETRAPWILVVNPDAAIRTETPAALVAALEAAPDCAVAGPRIENLDGSLQQSARAFPSPLTGLFGRASLLSRLFPGNPITRRNLLAREGGGREPYRVDWVSGAVFLLRRDAYEAVGGFDEGFFMYWEDADLARRLAAAGYRTLYVPGVTATHECGVSSDQRRAESIRAFHESAYRYVGKHIFPGALAAPLRWAAGAALGARSAWLRARAG